MDFADIDKQLQAMEEDSQVKAARAKAAQAELARREAEQAKEVI